MTPALTSVDMASEAIGEIAMRSLVRIVAGNGPPPAHEVVASRVVVRESTTARMTPSSEKP